MSPHPDAAIIAGLQRWRAAVVAYMVDPRGGDHPEWSEMVGVANLALVDVASIPAEGVEGLAIKAYLSLRHEMGGADPLDLGVDLDNPQMRPSSPAAGVIADAVRMSPTLAEMLA